MCRDDSHGGRRCPSDTSLARQLRRKNSDARKAYAGLAEPAVESKALPEVTSKVAVTAETIKADIETLNRIREGSEELPSAPFARAAAFDKQLNVIGDGVWKLAEEKYGAPKDEELQLIQHEAEDKAMKAADARKAEAEKVARAAREREKDLKRQLNDIANTETHPLYTDREAAWKEKAPELWEEYGKAFKNMIDTQKKVFVSHSGVSAEISAATREILEKRNEAMKAALTDVGVQFADPESFKYSSDSHSDAVKSLKKSLAFFPQSWIDNSNHYQSETPLRVKRSQGRAHYSENRRQTTYQHVQEVYVDVRPEGWKPDLTTKEGQSYIDMNGEKSWTDPKSGRVHYAYRMPEGHRAWLRVNYDYHPHPKKGYEPVTYAEEVWTREGGFQKTGKMVTEYRKARFTREQTGISYKAELTVTKDAVVRVGDDAGFRVGLHEFSHRVEHTTPIVKAYESAFLTRRAGQISPEGERLADGEKLSAIFEGRREKGYKDNFPTHYMGKVYEDGSREILSMGMESLFAGKNGALAGMEGYKADADYKRFILGILASTAKPADSK